MHIFLTGATGFIGSYVLKALRAAGHTVRCLVRETDRPLSVEDDGVEKVKGNIQKPDTLSGLMRGCDAVIHLVGIIDEHPGKGITFEKIHDVGTGHVINAAQEEQITQFFQMSANGARPDGVSGYQTSKWAAEERVRNAGFEKWCILRPSLVFGDPGPDRPEFCTRLAQTLIKPFPVLPVFGDGKYQMQPVSVQEVAAAFVQALTEQKVHGQTLCVAGPEQFTYNEILDIIAQGMGLEPKPKVHQPLWLVRPIIETVGKWGILPISTDQFRMLLEGNTCNGSSFYDYFTLEPRAFSPESLAYLRERT